MKTYFFYDNASGAIHPMSFTGPEGMQNGACPQGHTALEGSYDHLRYRFNLGTGLVEQYQPQAPADTDTTAYVWDAEAWRWVATPTLLARQLARVAQVDQDILLQEARRVRPASEATIALALGTAVPAGALAVLQETEAALAALRAARAAMLASTSGDELDAVSIP